MKRIFVTVKKSILISFVFLIPGSVGLAQDFVYQAINPAFGGNYFNYQWMLASAQSQNKLKETVQDYDRTTSDPLEEFESNITRQILSQISRQLIQSDFGTGKLTEGQYAFGSYEIDIQPGDIGVDIRILDTATGNETLVTVPYF
jgi:curli production assembly/transport component CsgF